MGNGLLGVNHNLPSVNLHRNVKRNSWAMAKSMEKLASGLAINKAADNPAGLVISEQMRTQMASLNQKIENVSNRINKYNTADSTLLQMRGQLTQMRSLAVAAANEGAVDENMRQAYQSEVDNITGSYNQIRENSTFASQALLDGSEGSVTNVSQMPSIDLSSAEASREAINRIDQEIQRLDSTITEVGAYEKHNLQSTLSNLRVESQNLTAAESSIRDIDYAKEFTNFLKNKMLFNSGISMMAHTGSSPQALLSIMGAKR